MARRTRAAARPRKGAHQARRRARAATTRAALGAGGEGVPLRHGRRGEAAGRALRWTIPAARLPLHVRPELRGRLPDLLIDGRRYRRPAPTPARPRRDVRIRLTSTTGEAAAHRRTQRQLDRHRSRWLPHGAVWVQHLRTRRRHRLPHLLDDRPRSGVSDGLLPDPRPRTEGPRRGRGLAGLDPPGRRVREGVTRSAEQSAPRDSALRRPSVLLNRGSYDNRRQISSGDWGQSRHRTGASRGSLQLKGATMSAVPTIHRFPVEQEGAFVNAYLVETASGVVAVDGLLQLSAAQEMRVGLDRLGQPLPAP